MGLVFNENQTKYIYVAIGEKENVKLAVNDLIKDIKSVCGDAKITDCKEKADIFVCSKDSFEFNELSKGEVAFSHVEEFCYIIEQEKLFLFGADDLGVSWAIYSFLENELKIPPFYIFEDIKLQKKKSIVIEDKTVQEYPYTRFRGWFINDEDLLSKFQSKGKRNIAYDFYHDVVHPELMAKIVETALRFRINLIIPASFLDICKPDQENLVKEVARRGLYVSQHHLEPMGVSHFAYSDFVKEHGYNSTLSFISNCQPLVECWNVYAKKWANYPRVIWQLGLRGAGDIPVWESDKNVGDSDKERGELIASAIQTQYDIIKKYYKGEIYSSSTLWMEGSKLLQSGNLTLPKDTIVVFADIGMSQTFGDDFFTVPRIDNTNYGIYYHSQYWHTGPHLAEGVLPEKIDYSYKLARENKSDYYAILNVSNVKEFTFSINVNSKLQWYGNKKTLEEIITDYAQLYVGNYKTNLIQGISYFYKALGDIGEENYYAFCKKYNFNYHKYTNLSFPVCNINDGMVFQLWRKFPLKKDDKPYEKEFSLMVENAISCMEKAYEIFTDLQNKVSKGYDKAIQKQWRWQSYYFKNLFYFVKEVGVILEQYLNDNFEDCKESLKRATTYLKDLIGARKEFFTGEWANWFDGDEKLNLQHLHDLVAREIDKL